MATVLDLGRQVKAKYPGQYDDMEDGVVGSKIKAKYPGSYDDYTEMPTPQEVDTHFKDYAPSKSWKDHPIREMLGGAGDMIIGAAQSAVPKNWKDYATDAVLGPLARPLVGMAGSHLDQAKQALDPNQGRFSRQGHALAAITPGGPIAAQIGETFPNNPPRAFGMAGGVAAMGLASKIPSRIPAVIDAIPGALNTTGRVIEGAARGAAEGMASHGWGPGAAMGAGLGKLMGDDHGAYIGGSIGAGLPAVTGAVRGAVRAYKNDPIPRRPFPAPPVVGSSLPPEEVVKSYPPPRLTGSSIPPEEVIKSYPPPRLVGTSIPPEAQRVPGTTPPPVRYNKKPGGDTPSTEDVKTAHPDIPPQPSTTPQAESSPIVTTPEPSVKMSKKALGTAKTLAKSFGSKKGEPVTIPFDKPETSPSDIIFKNVVGKLKSNGVTPETFKTLSESDKSKAMNMVSENYGKRAKFGPTMVDRVNNYLNGGEEFAAGGVVAPQKSRVHISKRGVAYGPPKELRRMRKK